MIKLFTGNICEGLQAIRPQVLVCIADVRGTGIHPLSNVLFRDYTHYNLMLDELRYRQIDRKTLVGKYMYRNEKANGQEETHILAFVDPEKLAEFTFSGNVKNPELFSILTALASSMRSSGKKTIAIPYYGSRLSGYRFRDFLELLEQVFDEDMTVYLSVSQQYTTMCDKEVLSYTAPIVRTSDKRRIIYTGQGTRRVVGGGETERFRDALGQWMNNHAVPA